MRYFLLFLLLFPFAFLYGQQDNPMEIKLVVASEKIACNNTASMCFNVKKISDPYWTFQIEEIENFDYVPGFEYTVVLQLALENGEQKYQFKELVEKIATN